MAAGDVGCPSRQVEFCPLLSDSTASPFYLENFMMLTVFQSIHSRKRLYILSSAFPYYFHSCLRDIKRGKCYADRKEELQTIGYNFLIHGKSCENKDNDDNDCRESCVRLMHQNSHLTLFFISGK